MHAPKELVNVYSADSALRGRGNLSYPDYRYLREHSRRLSGVAAYAGLMTTLTGQGTPEVLFGEIVSGNYFAVTGARLALGRGFLPSEDLTPGADPVVVIGHYLWQRRFGGDSSVVGRTVTLNGHPFTVVGVRHSTRRRARLHRGGIRRALGARATDVLRLVLAGSLRAVAIGLVIGLCLALAIGRLVAGFLFGIGGNDPLAVGGIMVTLPAASATAALGPAPRATRVHPSVALRGE